MKATKATKEVNYDINTADGWRNRYNVVCAEMISDKLKSKDERNRAVGITATALLIAHPRMQAATALKRAEDAH